MMHVNFFFFRIKQFLSKCGDRCRYIVLPGGEVPNWFSHKRNGSNSISFQIPSLPKAQIKGLFVCAVWAPDEEIVERFLFYSLLFININNNRSLDINPHGVPLRFVDDQYSCGHLSCMVYIPNPFAEDEIASGM
jgi:hypothetical protein